MDRYEQLAAAFVGLADTLVADYDVVELAHQLIDGAMTLLPITPRASCLVTPTANCTCSPRAVTEPAC